jgi:hypothetical protein
MPLNFSTIGIAVKDSKMRSLGKTCGMSTAHFDAVMIEASSAAGIILTSYLKEVALNDFIDSLV